RPQAGPAGARRRSAPHPRSEGRREAPGQPSVRPLPPPPPRGSPGGRRDGFRSQAATMHLFRRNLARDGAPVDGGGDAVLISHILVKFLKRLRHVERPHLLDLGRLCGSNIEFFAGRGLKVHVEDLLPDDGLGSIAPLSSGRLEEPLAGTDRPAAEIAPGTDGPVPAGARNHGAAPIAVAASIPASIAGPPRVPARTPATHTPPARPAPPP